MNDYAVHGSAHGSLLLARSMSSKHDLNYQAGGVGSQFKSISVGYVAICCVGSVLFGYGISCMNCMKKTLAKEFGWQDEVLKHNFSTLSTAIYVGAAVGSFCGGVLSKRGRRTLNMVLHVFFIAGGLVCCFANGFTMLLVGRLLMGFAVGLVTVASPMIISEISRLETRGSNGVCHQLAITVGILLGLALGTPLNMEEPPLNASNYVRVMLGLPAILSSLVLLIIGFWKTDDTPNYLANIGKKDEAVKLLRDIYLKKDVDYEYRLISSGSEKGGQTDVGLCYALVDPWYRKCLIVGVLLSMGQQLSGINAFVSLSNSVFENAGLTGTNLSMANTLMSVMNCLMTFPAIWIIEAFGRRPLYILGNVGQTFALAMVPITILAPWSDSLPIVSVASVVGYVMFFAVSNGPVLWVYLNEIFPPELAGTACGLCCALNWISGILVVFGVSQFEDPKYTFSIFTSFTVACFFAALFCIFVVRETKGRSNADSPYLEGRQKGETKPLNAEKSEKYV